MVEIFKKHKLNIGLLCLTIFFFILFFIILPWAFSNHYSFSADKFLVQAVSSTTISQIVFKPSYVDTPGEVKGIYMTSWTASRKDLREPLVNLIENTELNSMVIDIKDYSGRIVFPVFNPLLKSFGSEEVRIIDLPEFIESLHKKGIYVIGRVAVFQDAYFVKYRPDLAVRNLDGTSVWKDKKGISWIDPGSKEYWNYIVLIAKESRKIGFDEINFDYIRFPSDGNMEDISYPFSSTTPKAIVLKNFFKYLNEELSGTGLKTSADIFGMTTTATSDMGIGQILENALPYFDYVSPMVYPSHYPPTFMGYKNPAEHPYDVIHYAMESAVNRAQKLAVMASSTVASSTVSSTPDYKGKLRPWLQDFNLGANYGPDEVRAQIKATYDVGLNSWTLWSAANRYTKGALEPK